MKGVDSTTVLYEVDSTGVLTLTLNRPDRNNAWNMELGASLHELLEQASESEDVRAIVVTGAGKSFSPGMDTDVLQAVASPGFQFGASRRRPTLMPTLVPKPIICAINGACAGIALTTALMMDIRFVAEDAKLTTAFSRRGLPAEDAIAWVLPRIAGHGVALDLLMSGRVITGREAADLGLAHRSVPREELLQVSLDYARDLALSCSPAAMAAMKRQIYLDWDRSFSESLGDALRLVPALKESSNDVPEGVRSFVEKRPPRFSPIAQPVDYSGYVDLRGGSSR